MSICKEVLAEMQSWQIIVGLISSSIFVLSTLPMLWKVYQTRDLKSYSLGNIALSNLGNLIHWVYVAGLPIGPIWLLHGFSTLSTALMLLWYLRYEMGCVLLPRVQCQRASSRCFSGG